MTTSRYIIARFAQSFGLLRRQKRMGDAASETHLLKEAEFVLGKNIWQKCEQIDEISLEYWNLRQLNTKQQTIQAKLDEAEQAIAEAHNQRAQIMNQKSDTQSDLEDKRDHALQKLEHLTNQRDEVIEEARQLRRHYDSAQAKLDVLGNENEAANDANVSQTRERMNELKEKIHALKKQRDQTVHNIEHLHTELNEIDHKLNDESQNQRHHTSASLQKISDLNKEISSFKAEIGLLESQMHELYSTIGRHVSRYAHIDPKCREAAANHRSLVEIMKALRRSIHLNFRLVNQ